MTEIIRDPALLHPVFRPIVDTLMQELRRGHETRATQTRFELFETFRRPERQRDLITKGVSKAGAFQSAHQFGLAVDIVPYIDPDTAAEISKATGERHWPGWSWWTGHDWDYLSDTANRLGLRTISWDRPHVEYPHWRSIRDQIAKSTS